MATISTKTAREALRAKYLKTITDYLTEQGEEVLVTGSNEIALPCVSATGDDEYIVVTVKVPTGSRDGEAYDGHIAAQDYADHLAEKERKAKAAAEKKAKKMAADKAAREAKAAAREKAKAEKAAAETESEGA